MKPQLAIPIIGPTTILAQKQIEDALPNASILEIRADLIEGEIPALPPLPIIFTCRDKVEKLKGFNPEYIDIDYSKVKESDIGSSKLIASYHNFIETPEDLSALLQEMKTKAPNAFLYKIACHANSSTDSLRMLIFLKNRHSQGERVLGMCMGELGIPTRILSPIFQNPFTFAAVDPNTLSAKGQLTAIELIETYSFNKLTPHTKIYSLIGNPVDKSQSHLKHNESFRRIGFDGVYVKFKVTKEELPEFLTLAKELPIRGLSVTMPLKEVILPFIHEVSSFGAVNTLVLREGQYLGFNTDAPGAIDAINERTSLKDKTVYILGAGGVALALAKEAKKRGATITLFNRDPARGKITAEKAGAAFFPLQAFKPTCDILIQATSVGMEPNVNDTLVDTSLLSPHTIILDAVSRPRETRLLREAKARGCTVIDGVEMFERQGKLQFQLWKVSPHNCSHC